MRILFAGTPGIAVPSLRVTAGQHQVCAVLTGRDRPAGRGRSPEASEVKKAALAIGLPVIEADRLDAGVRETIRRLAPDLLVVVAFGRIFRTGFLDLFPRGGVNVHPSLLPRYRGPSPITAAILAGDRETGVTVQRIALEVDAGDVYARRTVPLDGTETTGSLTPVLAEVNLLVPIRLDAAPFASVGLTYVLHCLPGGMREKLAAVDHLRPLMEKGAVLFGATILGRGVAPNRAARALLDLYNAKGVFNNRDDDLVSLSGGLRQRFDKVEIESEGCVALFRAA